jgi:hypothetical protein
MTYRLTLANSMNKNSKPVDMNQGSDFYTIDEAHYRS